MQRKADTYRVSLWFLILWSVALVAEAQQSPGAESTAKENAWAAVSQAVGRAGREQPDGTYTVVFPRGDLDVTVDGIKLAPALWMASSATFSVPGDNAMMMGDLLLTEQDVATIIPRLAAESIEVAALHTHLTRETPRLMFLHVESHGNAVKIAQSLRTALEVLKLVPPTNIPPLSTDFDLSALEEIIGQKARPGGGGVHMAVPRRESITMNGMSVPASMASTSVLHFQPLGKGKVAISGDLVLLAPEVNPVIRVLGQHGIEITTIHNHMLAESPRLFFLHYWAAEDQAKVAKGLRAALDLMNPGAKDTR